MLRHGRQLFTSESVSEGHPDKVCDQISDAVLDTCLAQDALSRVACETLATTDTVVVSGEITTGAKIDIELLVREVVKEIGYVYEGTGFDYKTLNVLQFLHQQSSDIAMGVDASSSAFGMQGAGDQGMMFGYACTETPELMPAPVMFSHRILQRAAFLRKSHDVTWLRPDAKAQVTVAYEAGKPIGIDTVVVSHQHDEHVSRKELETYIREQVIQPSLGASGLLSERTKYHINPTGRFVIGGPTGDTGLTGRKIIVDTYGGMGRHGGGAFSGKDPSKVDRSAAYMARFVAKNLVAWGLCSRCEVQFSYAIGVPEPVSILVDTFGTGTVGDQDLESLVMREFDLSPAGIIEQLDLLRPIYRAHMNYGHFGKSGVPWEQVLPKPSLC
ncbi:MAG: methionine adenosyltransferase [Sphaerochaetaceae bacterium]|jgi:S-adenosylmethionine synthetase|nr:methionine adenosyltransferase [Sphaerochaetaceae bacterium]MDX9938842.1 methionine adenosyltransferase [Sphaerochaetaceae bacterium]